MLDTLQQVLDQAHAGHIYVTDRDQYSRPEHWTLDLVGDCEDFALWCRRELADWHIPSNLILCRIETGEGHLVCATDDGWVLDNRYQWVMRRDDLPYTWISIGKPDGCWYEITK